MLDHGFRADRMIERERRVEVSTELTPCVKHGIGNLDAHLTAFYQDCRVY
jgi:hypothetical protein